MSLRRYLFLGLTLVLIVALTSLVLKGYKQEKQQARQLIETVEEARPSRTKVVNPQDLKVLQSKMELLQKSEKGSPIASVRNEVEIYNDGSVTYTEVLLRFVYISRNSEKLKSVTHLLDQPIPPGAKLSFRDINITEVSYSAATLETTVVSAEIESSNKPRQ